jgi:hypothetical protein
MTNFPRSMPQSPGITHLRWAVSCFGLVACAANGGTVSDGDRSGHGSPPAAVGGSALMAGQAAAAGGSGGVRAAPPASGGVQTSGSGGSIVVSAWGGYSGAPAGVAAAGASNERATGGVAAMGGTYNGAGGAAPLQTGDSLRAACEAPPRDACAACVCSSCKAELARCDETAGCTDILKCVAESGCSGAACYCGTIDVLRCANGEANGPCKAAMLSAPGSRTPTLADASAGPASDAALGIANCMQGPRSPCAAACE